MPLEGLPDVPSLHDRDVEAVRLLLSGHFSAAATFDRILVRIAEQDELLRDYRAGTVQASDRETLNQRRIAELEAANKELLRAIVRDK